MSRKLDAQKVHFLNTFDSFTGHTLATMCSTYNHFLLQVTSQIHY